MTDVITLPLTRWDGSIDQADQARAAEALEGGSVVLLPELAFPLLPEEQPLLSSTMGGKSKNVSFDPRLDTVRGSAAEGATLDLLATMMKRYATCSTALLRNLFPRYAAGLEVARTSFRPQEIDGRATSWRKDDTRLHVDSFPSSPTGGKRILRVFSNVNPEGQKRTWRLGEPFEIVAQRYLPSIGNPPWGLGTLLHTLGITKGRRTAYDHFMLGLHDRMKADLAYQKESPQSVQQFASGNTWIVFTDRVSHAAMSGQYAFEQTFHLPVDCMVAPSQAPVRILESLLGRQLT